MIRIVLSFAETANTPTKNEDRELLWSFRVVRVAATSSQTPRAGGPRGRVTGATGAAGARCPAWSKDTVAGRAVGEGQTPGLCSEQSCPGPGPGRLPTGLVAAGVACVWGHQV